MDKKLILVLRIQKLPKYNFRDFAKTTSQAYKALMTLNYDQVKEVYQSINK